MSYIDGFVLPVPKKNLRAYVRMAKNAGKVWRKYDALDYKECVGDDLKVKMGVPFPQQMKVKRGETVVFSHIVYKSRACRDRVNAKVMKDPRMLNMCDPKDMPFDVKRIVYGGSRSWSTRDFNDTTHKMEGNMRVIYLVTTTLCLMLIASSGLAKEKKQQEQMDPQAMMELWKQAATPGEPHKMFATLVGSWTTTTKEWMEPGKPQTESTGTEEMKMLLDGRFLYQEYNSQMMGQPFSGIGIDAYDNLRKRYVTVWIDSMGTGIFLMEGIASADGKTITLRGSHPEPGGGHMTHRAIWKILDDSTQIFDMYGAHHGGKEMKMLEITYSRKQ